MGPDQPALPPHPPRPKGGKPPVDERVCLSGILFVLKTGISREEFPQEMGWHRAELRQRRIPPRLAHRHTGHGSGLGTLRYVAEQTLALLHQFRRLHMRFEKHDDLHEALMSLGCAVICWRRLNHGYF